MAYTTLEKLTARFGAQALIDLTDRGEVPTGAVDLDVINRAIADADAVIDGFLGVKYPLPLAEVPPLVGDVAATVTLWKLTTYEPDEKLKADYKDAIGHLKSIAKGEIRLPISTGATLEASGGSGARSTDRARPMTEANMKSFI